MPRSVRAKRMPIRDFTIVWSLLTIVLVFSGDSIGQNSETKHGSQSLRHSAPSADRNHCNAKMFIPNYSVEVGAFDSVRWERFPIAVWIDSSTILDPEEMLTLQTGLSAWSKATGGILGILFVQQEKDAQITVRMVDKLDGANGTTRYTLVEQDFVRRATINIVHSHWLGSQLTQYRPRTVQRDAAHEMGHALGIDRHTTRPNTIMLPVVSVDLPSPLDVNTSKTKYCELF